MGKVTVHLQNHPDLGDAEFDAEDMHVPPKRPLGRPKGLRVARVRPPMPVEVPRDKESALAQDIREAISYRTDVDAVYRKINTVLNSKGLVGWTVEINTCTAERLVVLITDSSGRVRKIAYNR